MRLLFIPVALFSIIVSLATGQESGSIQIRAVLHDPAKPDTKFFAGKPGEALLEVKLLAEGLGESQKLSIDKGTLNLFSSATVDAANAKTSLMASIKLPPAAGSLIVIILPAPKGGTTPYSGIALSDDPKSFPWGESKVVNLTPVEFAIEAGEHKVPLPAGKITAVPKVTKVDEYLRAQTNFFYKLDNQWVIAAERPMQYANALRRVFLVFKAENALAPDVRTIVDQPPPNMEGKP